jgi:Xaa-Pro aminopeptidase
MFPASTYIQRRKELSEAIVNGIIVMPGNSDVACNNKGNTYRFRQDSTFSYFFGLNEPDLIGIIDADQGIEYLFGDNIEIEDIIWMGNIQGIQEMANKAGVKLTLQRSEIQSFLNKAISSKRKIHYLPPYRGETIIEMQDWFGVKLPDLIRNCSPELIKQVIEMRSIKDNQEIAQIEEMIGVAFDMHTTVMKLAKPGTSEHELAGIIEGIALSKGNGISFPVILSMNGETLHNHNHGNILQKGRLLLTDAGSESELLYASDITRTIPIGGIFSQCQKEVYQIVLDANIETIRLTNPGVPFINIHLAAAKIIVSGLKNLGLMKGNIDDAIQNGAHALFFPHGLGHLLGMDVHDMEGLGEDNTGYDNNFKRSDQFGLSYLRFAKKPKPGFVLTDEPGIYFIPPLIDLWQKEKKFIDFINYDKVQKFRDFGGIRIEDDILVTENGCRVLGKPIPKTVSEIEKIMAGC